MRKIEAVDYDLDKIVTGLINGEDIYRIDHVRTTIINLGDKAIRQIEADERKRPEQYSYFKVMKEEENDED